MQVQTIFAFVLQAMVLTAGQEQPEYADGVAKPSYEQQDQVPHSFAWAVKDEPSKNDYFHQQENDRKITTGSYRIALPYGRTQIVTFKVDENGYVADVTYEGEARYHEYKPTSYNKPTGYTPPEAAQPEYPSV